LDEPQRNALHAVAALSKISAGVSPKFNLLVEDIKGNPIWGNEVKELVAQ